MRLLSLALFVSVFWSAAAGQAAPDLIIVNARVRTMDGSVSAAEAIAVTGGRITAVGRSAEIRRAASTRTVVIDAEGRLVLPGFNDAHVHFTGVGNKFSHLDLSDIRTADQFTERVRSFTRFLPKGRWLIGAKLQITDVVSLKELDAASPDNPLLLYLSDPAIAVVNSAAMRSAGMKAGQADDIMTVAGQRLAQVRNAIPKNHGSDWAAIIEAASNYAAANGVTSVQDVHSDDLFRILEGMAASGRLKTRIYDCVGLGDWERAGRPAAAANNSEIVRRGCVKWATDGSPEEREELGPRVAAADREGMQVLVHAIGGRANTSVVDAFEFLAKRDPGRDRRSRIEHAHQILARDIPRVRRGSIILSMQPALFYRGGSTGDDQAAFLRAGVHMAFGSDSSMIDIDPLAGIHAAVNSGAGSLTVEEAVRAYTLGSAYAEFQEKAKGTISVGKLADLVMLSDDIFTIDKRRIGAVKPVLTVMDGKVVFDSRSPKSIN